MPGPGPWCACCGGFGGETNANRLALPGAQPFFGALGRHRSGDEVALDLGAAEAAQGRQGFLVFDALGDGGSISWSYVASAAGYAATWCAFVLGLGALALRQRDLG